MDDTLDDLPVDPLERLRLRRSEKWRASPPDVLPLTVAEWEEWGDPRIPEHYRYLKSYSPYENLPGPHRPALLVTADASPQERVPSMVGLVDSTRVVAAGETSRGESA